MAVSAAQSIRELAEELVVKLKPESSHGERQADIADVEKLITEHLRNADFVRIERPGDM